MAKQRPSAEKETPRKTPTGGHVPDAVTTPALSEREVPAVPPVGLLPVEEDSHEPTVGL